MLIQSSRESKVPLAYEKFCTAVELPMSSRDSALSTNIKITDNTQKIEVNITYIHGSKNKKVGRGEKKR
jgi:hypothetical protein